MDEKGCFGDYQFQTWQSDGEILTTIQISLKLIPFHYRAKEKRNRLSLLLQKPEFHEESHSSRPRHFAKETRWITFNYLGGDIADSIIKNLRKRKLGISILLAIIQSNKEGRDLISKDEEYSIKCNHFNSLNYIIFKKFQGAFLKL